MKLTTVTYPINESIVVVLFLNCRNNIDKQAMTELQAQCQEYKTMFQVAQVERDKLSELVRVLQSRYCICDHGNIPVFVIGDQKKQNSNHTEYHFSVSI